MILLGQYDSPFVRRVAGLLHWHGIGFEREVLSVFRDFEAVLARNPLGKVPALQLDDGTWLYESRSIVEWVEAKADAASRLTPSDPDLLRQTLRLEAVAVGLAEKGYERGVEVSRRDPSARDLAVIRRTERQIASALSWLEAEVSEPWAVGQHFGRADLAIAVALTYLSAKLPALYDAKAYPRLEALRSQAEALPAVKAAPYSATEAAASGWTPPAESRKPAPDAG
ncbi:MAG: glutathione S-transferase family protein [Pseudomonadota bacterium]